MTITQLPIVDSHVHLWDPNRLSYAWHADVPALNRPFLLADYDQARGQANVEGIIFVQCGGTGKDGAADRPDSMKEVDWVTKLAGQDSRLKGLVAHAPLESGAIAAEFVEKLGENKLVKGVRRLIQDEPLGFCSNPKFIEGVQLLVDADLSFDICIYHRQMADALTLVKQCPQVRFVLDHIGKPDIKAQLEDPWKAQLKELAGFDNVWCKISGMITEADHDDWKPDHLKPFLDHALDCFGTDRVMFGSDWPVMILAGKWTDWLEVLSAEISTLAETEQKKLLSENAVSFYRMES